MLILGAKGHAKEVLKVALDNGVAEHELFFFDDVTRDGEPMLFGRFPILKTMQEAIAVLEKDDHCVLGLGSPLYRRLLYDKFKHTNARFINLVSRHTYLSPDPIAVTLGEGLNIMDGVFISNDIRIGTGCLLNFGCSIHHDATVGDFCELGPKSQVLGGAVIGNDCFIGAGAIILPKVVLADKVTVGAGAVVTKSITTGCVVAGVPATKIK